MQIKIELAVKPLVKAYLENNFGSPVITTRRSLAGRYFFKLLEKQENHWDCKYKAYSEKVTILISEDVLFRHGSEVTPTTLIEFNNFITDHIYEMMFFSIEMQEENSKDAFRINQAIQSFLLRFNFTEEILSFETAKKAYYRHRERENLKVNAE